MPKYDDRFARQNRCGPPPEFPLASSYSGIVHHLSGPNVHALAPPHRRRGRDGPAVRPAHAWDPGSRLGPPRGGPSPSLRPRVSTYPATRAHVRLLGPCFKTGRTGSRPIRRPASPPAIERGPRTARGPGALRTVHRSRMRGPGPARERVDCAVAARASPRARLAAPRRERLPSRGGLPAESATGGCARSGKCARRGSVPPPDRSVRIRRRLAGATLRRVEFPG